MNVSLKPFPVPTDATFDLPGEIKCHGFLPTIKLSDIPIEELVKLCDDWRANVFAKAGKRDPGKAYYGVDCLHESQTER